MKNLVARTITGVLFVAAVVVSFLDPMAMTALFALVTGLSVWEFTGLVNERNGVTVNRFITTVAGKGCFVAEKNLDLIREQQLKNLEDHLSAAAELARSCGVTPSELQEMLRILLEEES